jgi:hypothetical protein
MPFGDILLSNRYLPVATGQVNLGEDLGSVEPVEKLIHPWEGVFVLDGDLVETPIVNAHAQATVLLGSKEHWSPIGRGAWADHVVLDKEVHLPSQLSQLRLGEADDGSAWGFIAFCGDLMLHLPPALRISGHKVRVGGQSRATKLA